MLLHRARYLDILLITRGAKGWTLIRSPFKTISLLGDPTNVGYFERSV